MDSPKSTKEIQRVINDKNARCLAATISNYPQIFLRLDKGFVGLVGRDEHLVKDWKKEGLPLYKKLVNCLQDGPKTTEQLYFLLPEEKKVSIRASATFYPHLFIRLAHGVIGRKNRDEHLVDRYRKPSIRKIRKEKRETVGQMLELILADGPKSLEQIRRLLPSVNYNLITCKLSLGKRFVRVGKGVWGLNEKK